MISILKPQNLSGKKYILYFCGLFNKLEVDKLKELPLNSVRNTLKTALGIIENGIGQQRQNY